MKNRVSRTNEINALREGFVTAFSRFTNIIGDRIIAPRGHPELRPEEVGNGGQGTRAVEREPVAVTVARLALPPEDHPQTFRVCAAQDLGIAAGCRRAGRSGSREPLAKRC